jgi:hypothetical protein
MEALAPAGPTAASAWPSIGRDLQNNLRVLDQMMWAYGGPRLQALGFDFAIRASNGTVGRYLGELMRAFEVRGEPRHIYSFIDREHSPDALYELYRDGEQVSSTSSPSTMLRHLLWDVNRSVIEESKGLLLFHASAVEHGGRAVVFPAPMGSGKTTLVARLVQRGLRYVTDEAVAIDPITLMVRPYPKPLGIDPGSWGVLSDLRPDVDAPLKPFLEEGWYVPPDSFREGAVAPPCVPGFVIAPRYERGTKTNLVEMRRSEALIRLAENSFNIPAFGARRSMEILAGVVRSARCYRLTVGDLADACTMVLELLETAHPNRMDE